MEFYLSVLGGKLDVQTFKDLPASEGSSDDDLIMHAMLVTDNGMTLMAADIPARWNTSKVPITLISP